MKPLVYIRLASYAACIAAFVIVGRERRVIPLTVWGYEEQEALDDRRSAAKSAAAIPSQGDFRNTRLSGSAVVAKAIAAAKHGGEDFSGYGEPQILLKEKGGKLVWFVSFYLVPGVPGGFFTVVVDDTSGETTVYPGM